MPVENQELDEAELFNQAISDEPVETEAGIPTTEVEQPEKPETEAAAETETTEPEKPAVDDNAPLVPSWRLREINEEKRALAERVKALEAERLAPRPQAEPPKPVEKPVKPDPLLDPDGYEKYLEQKFEERQLSISRENSLKLAARTYKDEFQEAYKAAQQKIDPALRALMQASDDPGETLVQWHRENKVKAEVGSDPNAWLEKKLEERLKDPTFLAKAVELARGSAQQPQQTNGRPRVELPPSLNGASRSNAALRSDNTDVSDGELFREIAG